MLGNRSKNRKENTIDAELSNLKYWGLIYSVRDKKGAKYFFKDYESFRDKILKDIDKILKKNTVKTEWSSRKYEINFPDGKAIFPRYDYNFDLFCKDQKRTIVPKEELENDSEWKKALKEIDSKIGIERIFKHEEFISLVAFELGKSGLEDEKFFKENYALAIKDYRDKWLENCK